VEEWKRRSGGKGYEFRTKEDRGDVILGYPWAITTIKTSDD
jgi:hypothetical protein